MLNDLINFSKELIAVLNQNLEIITLIVLAYTAWQAFRSSYATAKANELKLLPLLTIHLGMNQYVDDFLIKNFGEGPALDIHIEPWILVLRDLQRMWELKMRLDSDVNILESKATKRVDYKFYSNGVEQTITAAQFMLVHLSPRHTGKLPRVTLTIRFKNALGERYFTDIETGRGGVNVKVPARKIRLRDEIRFLLRFNLKTFVYLNGYKFFWKIKDLYKGFYS